MTTSPIAGVTAATTVDGALVQALPGLQGAGWSVHSVHRQVVNLLGPGDYLCCLATEELDDAPRTVRVAWPDRAGLSAGHPVRVTGTTIDLRDRLIELAAAARWFPQPADLGALPADALQRAAALLDPGPDPHPTSPFERASTGLVRSGTAALAEAVRAGDHGRLATAAVRLVGLGAGLTPTGDDILTGLAVLLAQPGMLLSPLLLPLREAIGGAARRTTAVSAATLTEALAGRARQRIHDLIRTFPAGRPEEISAAAAHVRRIGHSSGADLLTGLRLGLLLEAEARRCPRAPSMREEWT